MDRRRVRRSLPLGEERRDRRIALGVALLPRGGGCLHREERRPDLPVRARRLRRLVVALRCVRREQRVGLRSCFRVRSTGERRARAERREQSIDRRLRHRRRDEAEDVVVEGAAEQHLRRRRPQGDAGLREVMVAVLPTLGTATVLLCVLGLPLLAERGLERVEVSIERRLGERRRHGPQARRAGVVDRLQVGDGRHAGVARALGRLHGRVELRDALGEGELHGSVRRERGALVLGRDHGATRERAGLVARSVRGGIEPGIEPRPHEGFVLPARSAHDEGTENRREGHETDRLHRRKKPPSSRPQQKKKGAAR